MEGQYTVLDSNLEPEKHGPADVEDRVQKKGGKPGQCLYLLLVIFAIIAISATITTIALGITLGVRSSAQTGPSTSQDSNTCLTQGCIQLAAQMTAAMNESVDPCEDFYQFSCGNWGQNNFIPPGGKVQNPLVKSQITLYQRMADILGSYSGVEAVGKAFNLYQSCMDAATIDGLGATPVVNVIRDKLGGWPLIGIPETTPWSINSTSFFYENLQGNPLSALFNLKLFFNAVTQSRSKYTLHFQQQLAPITTPSTDISPVAAVYATILSRLNSSINQTVYVEALQDVFEFEQRLLQILEPPSNIPNIMDGDAVPLLNESNIYTLEGLSTLWPEFNWGAFINYIYVNISGLTVPQNLKIVVTTPAYFKKLSLLLQNTSQEVIRDYTKLLFVRSQFINLGREYTSPENRNNITDPTPGDLIACMSFVQYTLPIAMARPYVEQFVPKGTKEGVSMMIDYILQGFRERVNQMSWLSALSKQSSLEKLAAITSQSGYPPQIFNNDYVNGLYSRFTPNPNDFYGNRLKATELALRTRLNLTYGYDKAVWPAEPNFLAFPTLVNAAYNRQTNQIYIMAAIENAFFRADWPDYFVFGGLGSVLGHEITHGFDNNGQPYDKDGARRMSWSNESQAEFNRRLQCFVDQYEQFTFEGVQVNGQRTLPENVADNGGLHASFQAYRMRAATTPQQSLPSLQYTPEQLFFIAYGQAWCELALPSYYEFIRNNDPHAPGPARTRAVINSPEFAKAFNCPAGSPMNPTNKCLIW